MGKIYVGDIGKEIRLDVGIDLTDYNDAKIYVRTPTGDTIWFNVTVTSGDTEYGETEGMSIIQYISDETDFQVKGVYILVAYVDWGTSSIHYGEPAKLIVYDRFTS